MSESFLVFICIFVHHYVFTHSSCVLFQVIMQEFDTFGDEYASQVNSKQHADSAES